MIGSSPSLLSDDNLKRVHIIRGLVGGGVQSSLDESHWASSIPPPTDDKTQIQEVGLTQGHLAVGETSTRTCN